MIRNLPLSLALLLLAACNLQSPAQLTQTPATATPLPTNTFLSPLRKTMTAIANTSTPSADAELDDIPNTSIIYYDIVGSSESQLRAQLDALGPVDDSGYQGDALTNWFIYWNWPGYGSSSCNLSQATVRYEIEIIFPRWTPPGTASSALVTKWTEYTRALAEHEKGHIDIVVANYQTVLEAIQNATCDTADEAATQAIEPIRQLHRGYDSTTGHGEMQGAVFP